jgi:hypothetical protein
MKRMKTIIHLQGIIVCLLLLAGSVFGQGFEQSYWWPGGSNGQINCITPTNDGGYIATGKIGGTPWQPFSSDAILIKIDVHGDTSWMKVYNHPDWPTGEGYSVKQTSDGGYIVVAEVEHLPGYWWNARLIKTDAFGDTLWTKRYLTGSEWTTPRDVIEVSTGGYVFVGSRDTTPPGPYIAIMVRTDASGDTMWTKHYPTLSDQFNVAEAPDGNFIMSGEEYGWANGNITKINANNGNIMWSELHQGPAAVFNVFRTMDPTSDGGYILAGNDYEEMMVVKTDAAGVAQWNITYPNTGGITDTRIYGGKQAHDGGYVLVGAQTDAGAQRFYIVKLDASGNIVWEKKYGRNFFSWGYHCEVLSNGNIIAGGQARDPEFLTLNSYAILADSLGNLHSNFLKGNVFDDNLITNCQLDNGELSYNQWMVEVTGDDVVQGLTDSLGNYSIPLDSGSYVATVIPPNPYVDTSPCAANGVPFSLNSYDTLTIDYPMIDTVNCPYLTVDVSTPFLRRCFMNTYTVNYCNVGTADEFNAFIEVELDPWLYYNGSSIPFSSQSGNVFTFDVDTLLIGECGSFTIDLLLDCDSTITGQTHCVDAHIYPDSICAPVPQAWNQAIIDVDATCVNDDSLQLKISNIGIGNMTAPLSYYVVEDDIMINNGSFNLPAGNDYIFMMDADGSTYNFTAEQTPGYPGFIIPTITIEGCGDQYSGNFNIGYFNTFPEDDMAPFESMDCQESVASYDPNDKRGFTQGYGAQHYIDEDTELDYHIRFQNTGTDTAFTVVIRDTLSPHLDITTVVPGASSHNYTFQIYNGRVMEWTFNNILLPDSNVNEPASNGFIKYHVKQAPNNPIGTVIENTAGICFDFNAPVITNTTFHTIGDNFIVLSIDNIEEENVQLTAAPNPFSDVTTIQISGEKYRSIDFELYDMNGKLVESIHENYTDRIQLQNKGWEAGMYFFNITSEGKPVGNGKLIVR